MLDVADKVASVASALIGLLGLVLTVHGLRLQHRHSGQPAATPDGSGTAPSALPVQPSRTANAAQHDGTPRIHIPGPGEHVPAAHHLPTGSLGYPQWPPHGSPPEPGHGQQPDLDQGYGQQPPPLDDPAGGGQPDPGLPVPGAPPRIPPQQRNPVAQPAYAGSGQLPGFGRDLSFRRLAETPEFAKIGTVLLLLASVLGGSAALLA